MPFFLSRYFCYNWLFFCKLLSISYLYTFDIDVCLLEILLTNTLLCGIILFFNFVARCDNVIAEAVSNGRAVFFRDVPG